ncbi:MAG TPA: polymer-forming cytoskeletal protein [Chloroflexi bacterium]|nr:polymer-forming cytoskeletal protein [Chloroflexota bacterium]
MALFKKNEGPAVVGGKIENVFGPNTSFQGHMRSDGNVRVDGVFEGTIETAGNVIIGPSARVMADITANAVQVWGAVRGNVTAHGRLEILPSGRVWGDIHVASLLIDEGGIFRGQCTMAGDDIEALSLPAPERTDVEGEAGSEVPGQAPANGTGKDWSLPSLQDMHKAVAESAADLTLARSGTHRPR